MSEKRVLELLRDALEPEATVVASSKTRPFPCVRRHGMSALVLVGEDRHQEDFDAFHFLAAHSTALKEDFIVAVQRVKSDLTNPRNEAISLCRDIRLALKKKKEKEDG
jgi:hypothetical protein